jgi:hypothetical protein
LFKAGSHKVRRDKKEFAMKLVTALTVAALMTAPTLGFAQGTAGGGTGGANSDGANGMLGNGTSGTGTGTGSDQMTPGMGRSSIRGQTSGQGEYGTTNGPGSPDGSGSGTMGGGIGK